MCIRNELVTHAARASGDVLVFHCAVFRNMLGPCFAVGVVVVKNSPILLLVESKMLTFSSAGVPILASWQFNHDFGTGWLKGNKYANKYDNE